MSRDSDFGIYLPRLSLVPGTCISPSICEQSLIKPVWILANFYSRFHIFPPLLICYQHIASFRLQSQPSQHRLLILSWAREFLMHILSSFRALIFPLFLTYHKGSVCPHFPQHQTLISASLRTSIGWHSPEYLEHSCFGEYILSI